MSAQNQFLAVYLGDPTGASRKAWDAMPQADQIQKMKDGFAAWTQWIETHHASIVVMGGPLGKTKAVDPNGTEDIRNAMTGFTVVKADSHEAAAKMFENHPHFAVFPGKSVEIMPVLPIPEAP